MLRLHSKGIAKKISILFYIRIAAACIPLLMLLGSTTFAQQEKSVNGDEQFGSLNVFQQSKLDDLRKVAVNLTRLGRLKQASKLIRELISASPKDPMNHYILARVLVGQNKKNAALERLTIAVRRGLSNANLLRLDPLFEPLRRDKHLVPLIEMIEQNRKQQPPRNPIKISPKNINNGIALVYEGNTLWDSKRNILKSFFHFPEKDVASKIIRTGKGNAVKILNKWYLEGRSAGNIGDLYDNHDRGHSLLHDQRFPQLSFVKYGSSARKTAVDYGLNTKMFFNAITVGNSSTVAAGRSQARHALTLPSGPEILYLQYANNHLYIYPEHEDYDSKRGDLIPANTPYMIVSQGSSSSDKPFMRAVLNILAAFKPAVKKHLRKENLVMPTVQMIFRRGQKDVITDADYLSAKAHPPVFKADNIDVVKMISLANQLNISDILPMVRMSIIDESHPRRGVDDFTSGISETLFDTPSAIARVVRSTAYEKRMVINVANTGAEFGKKIKYTWVVMSGDADRIQINPRRNDNSEVELIVPWHERRQVPWAPEMTTDRVEIAVFAHNGENFSAPAIINFLYPANQKRKYNERGQIVSIDHRDPKLVKRYIEPRLFSKRDWTDVYKYDDGDRLIGWQRKRGKWISNYSRDGAKITQWDDQDRATKARIVHYKMEADKQGSTTIVEYSGQKIFSYRYGGKNDQIGVGYEEKNP